PGPEGGPVVVDISSEHRILLVESRRADRVRIIPAMPDFAGAELFGFPAQVGGFGLADLVSAVAEELGVPFRHAKFPRRLRAAEVALALIPAAVHGPIPSEGGAKLAGKDVLHALGVLMLEPGGEFLRR